MSDAIDIASAVLPADLELLDVETREDTATIEICEAVREREEFDPHVDLRDIEVKHAHTWTCEVTRDGDITTPLAAPAKVRRAIEALDIDYSDEADEEQTARVLEVTEDEAREAAEHGESYEVDGITVYASQLFDRDGELRSAIQMCDGRVVHINETPTVAESGSADAPAVMADGGESVEDEDEIDEEYARAQAVRDEYTLDDGHAFGPDDGLLGTSEEALLQRLDRLADEIEHFDDRDEVEAAKREYVRLAEKLVADPVQKTLTADY